MKKKPIINSWAVAFILGLIYAGLWNVLLNMVNPAGNRWDVAHLVFAFGTSTISVASIYVSHLFSRRFFKKLSLSSQYAYMLLLSIPIFSIIYLTYWVVLIRKLFYGIPTDLGAYPGQLFGVTTGLHLGIAIITITSLYNSHVHKVEIRLSKLESLSSEAQLKNLQQQVHPHFLFNSLNILTALIKIDVERSVLFTQKLSEVYRFFLRTQKEVVISLEDELAFLHDYFYLVNCRFGNAFQLRIEGADAVLHDELFLIPGTLQLLVENAIKHNTASEEMPILISINVEEDQIVVANPVVKKQSHSSGYGLNNLVERYQLLRNEKIDYFEEEGVFTVCIPLIKNLLHR